MNSATHPAMQAMRAAYQTVNAARPKQGWFCRDVTYDGLALSLMFERDFDGLHLTEIQSQADGTEINWIPHHIAGLIKAQALEEMAGEEA